MLSKSVSPLRNLHIQAVGYMYCVFFGTHITKWQVEYALKKKEVTKTLTITDSTQFGWYDSQFVPELFGHGFLPLHHLPSISN